MKQEDLKKKMQENQIDITDDVMKDKQKQVLFEDGITEQKQKQVWFKDGITEQSSENKLRLQDIDQNQIHKLYGFMRLKKEAVENRRQRLREARQGLESLKNGDDIRTGDFFVLLMSMGLAHGAQTITNMIKETRNRAVYDYYFHKHMMDTLRNLFLTKENIQYAIEHDDIKSAFIRQILSNDKDLEELKMEVDRMRDARKADKNDLFGTMIKEANEKALKATNEITKLMDEGKLPDNAPDTIKEIYENSKVALENSKDLDMHKLVNKGFEDERIIQATIKENINSYPLDKWGNRVDVEEALMGGIEKTARLLEYAAPERVEEFGQRMAEVLKKNADGGIVDYKLTLDHLTDRTAKHGDINLAFQEAGVYFEENDKEQRRPKSDYLINDVVKGKGVEFTNMVVEQVKQLNSYRQGIKPPTPGM